MKEITDFKNFLFLEWKFLRLPNPTPNQYDIADYLQFGPKRKVIEGFRGVGKSWVTSSYVLWRLHLDPQLKFEVVSGTGQLAVDFTTFTLSVIRDWDRVKFLYPRDTQRQSVKGFDVRPAHNSQDPSVKSVGINGAITGTRADEIIADDIETPQNTLTPMARERLKESVKEFDSILKPLDGSRITYLGTPHTEESLYSELQNRGYQCRVWPARYPSSDLRTSYGDTLSPLIGNVSDREGETTEPTRFSNDDLMERELSYGRSGFAMQFMLDPTPADRHRHPLQLNDLIVSNVDPEVAPEKVVYSNDKRYTIDLPAVGFKGDGYHRPMELVGQHIPYQSAVLALDPSGRGSDETGFAVGLLLNGYIHIPEFGGFVGGYGEETLLKIAEIAKKYKVNRIVSEANFGDGMFDQLLRPILKKVYPCTIEEVRHHTQKEQRIIQTLEPLLNRHRLIIDPEAIKRDYESAMKHPPEKRRLYMGMYQLTHITTDRGSLTHDDRLEAIAMVASYFLDRMSVNEDDAMKAQANRDLDEELKGFLTAANSRYVVGEPLKVPNWLD